MSATNLSAETSSIPDHPHLAIRTANVRRLLECFSVKTELCRAAGGVNVSQLEQLLRDKSLPTYRPPSHPFMRRMERGLNLPEFTMDQPDGVEPFLPAIVEQFKAQGMKVGLPGALKERVAAPAAQRALPTQTTPSGLKPLHAATLAALQEALMAGRLTDRACLELMQAWMPAA